MITNSVLYKMIFDALEQTLARHSLAGACAYIAFYKIYVRHRLSKPLTYDEVFFVDFFSAAQSLCALESQQFFLSETTAKNLKDGADTWQAFCLKKVTPFLKQHELDTLDRPAIVRLIASDAVTFYEWLNDVGYLMATNSQRQQWLSESPLFE